MPIAVAQSVMPVVARQLLAVAVVVRAAPIAETGVVFGLSYNRYVPAVVGLLPAVGGQLGPSWPPQP